MRFPDKSLKMNCRVLSVLMWKHFVARKTKYIRTPVEFIAPLVIIILLYSFKGEIKPTSHHAQNSELVEIHQKESFPLEKVGNPSVVLYTPDTPKTQALMTLVAEKLSRSGRRLSTFQPFTNLSSIVNFTTSMEDDEAIVIFQHVSEATWPQTLNYTIRMKNAFMTAMHQSLDEELTPHSSFGTIYEKFMVLQWAIDTSYMELLTGKEVKQRVTIQEFPYVQHRGSSVSAMLATWMKTVCSISLLLPFTFLTSTLLEERASGIKKVTIQEFPYVQHRGSSVSAMLATWMKTVCSISLLLPFTFLTSTLLEERASGIKELVKMMGVSNQLLAISHVLNVLGPGVLFALMTSVLLTAGPDPLLEKTNGFIIFVVLMLYFLTVIAMAFVCSYLTKTTQYAVSLSVLMYLFLWMPASQLMEREITGVAVSLTGLLPHVPMTWLWSEVAQLEIYGQGVTFSTMFSSHSPQSGSVFAACLILLWQTLFLFLVAWYLDHVCPGEYGQPMPWNFFCMRQYWRKNDVTPNEELEELEEPEEVDQKYFEPAPPGQDVGIKVLNVTKVFPKHRALHNVSLDIHKGEITVLLGHNGAGKTTLMNIITGMTSATEGAVHVGGADVRSQRGVRRHIGLCPQHNLFIPDLNVIEHCMFFTMLKGGSFAEARTSSERLLNKLGILDKMNSKTEELSGGMKRRLQLACALAGSADVLILDEPTSGLDVETRRELWDLLLALRGTRTVLLSTHFMEEADALGDRVAALHAGRLRCYASPLYLKRAIGTGYRLTFTTIGHPKEEAITAVVTSHVPDATVKETSFNSISYNLPATSSEKFPELFSKLEYKRSELGIDSIGVGVSTLEEVFLRLCSDVDTTFSQDDVDGVGGDSEPALKRVTGIPLYFRQFKVLIMRQIYYVMSKRLWFLILQVILPVAMIVLFTMNFNAIGEPQRNLLLPLNLDVFDKMGDRRVLYTTTIVGEGGGDVRALSESYPKVFFEKTNDVNQALLRSGTKDLIDYNKYLLGLELNDTDAKILYTTTVRHAAPVGMNLLSNLLASQLLPWANGKTIITNNYPIDTTRGVRSGVVEPKSTTMAVMWAVTMVFIILATNINAVSLPCKERLSGARHLHVMAGAPASVHWATTLIAHSILAVITLVIPVVVAGVVLDTEGTFTDPAFAMTMMLVLTLGSAAFFSVVYLVSFYLAERGASVLLVFMLVFGLLLPGLKSAKDLLQSAEASKSFTDVMLLISSYIVPTHTLTVAASQTAITARNNALCALNREKCPNLFISEMGFDKDKCCESTGNMNCYLCFKDHSPGLMIVCLAVQLVFYMVLVWLTQRGLFKWVYETVMNARYSEPAPRRLDEMGRAERAYVSKAIALRAGWLTQRGLFKWVYETVMNARYSEPAPRRLDEMGRAERAYVSKAIALPTKQIPDAMLVSELHKNYRRLTKSFPAVKGISFSVKKGECFGLLGVNGAGKSSTFQMLTGESRPTRGQVYANSHRQTGLSTDYLRSLGYCPQFFGLDEFQTGAQNLEMMLTLRGLDAEQVRAEAASWIQVVGLQKYANRLVSGYSGGCLRRLAAGSALASGAPLTLLDEPTAGVDVAARRRVWAALRRALARRRAVIITSHSMDEMEALCHRIGIMSGGELCALGAPAALRAAHAAGHAVLIKLRPRSAHADETDGPNVHLNKLKTSLRQKFNCTLKDEHKTMLHYHINETLQYSELFRELEELRKGNPLIEDYAVTETTLEEVFLSFAKPPATPPPARPV